MKQAVICIVPNELQADRIVESLRVAGFMNSDISFVTPDKNEVRDMGHGKYSKAAENTSTGDGGLGWLAGTGVLGIPGVGRFIAAGPIMSAVRGAADNGGIVGGLIGLGLPEHEARQYESRIRQGNILLSVHTEDSQDVKRAEGIFKDAGALDVTRTGEVKIRVNRS